MREINGSPVRDVIFLDFFNLGYCDITYYADVVQNL
jgi:hypothetical protein